MTTIASSNAYALEAASAAQTHRQALQDAVSSFLGDAQLVPDPTPIAAGGSHWITTGSPDHMSWMTRVDGLTTTLNDKLNAVEAALPETQIGSLRTLFRYAKVGDPVWGAAAEIRNANAYVGSKIGGMHLDFAGKTGPNFSVYADDLVRGWAQLKSVAAEASRILK